MKPRDLHPEDPGDYNNPRDPEEVYQARLVRTRKQVIDYKHGHGTPQNNLEEGREFTRTELQTTITDFTQKDLEDKGWLPHIWDKGANTIMLTGTEMMQISAVTEQPQLNAQLLAITQAQPHRDSDTMGLDRKGLVSHLPYGGSNFPGRWFTLEGHGSSHQSH